MNTRQERNRAAFSRALDAMLEKKQAEKKLVEDLRAELAAARKRIAELEAERRWIPVGERLPEEGNAMLGLTRFGGRYILLRSEDCWFDNGYALPAGEWPTHWQPLPPPPQEG